jgi:hypothetical protein
MKNLKLPEDIQRKVLSYLIYMQSSLENQKEIDAFLGLVSPSLKLEVIRYVFSKVIIYNDILRGQDDVMEFIVRKVNTRVSLPEDMIIKQGETGDCMYFLARGECEIWVIDELKKDFHVKNIRPGSMFGEVSLIAKTKRTATVKCKNYCTIASLPEE